MERFARYNGAEWAMGNYSPEAYLNNALVPNFPDLRGATWRESVEGNKIVFEFYKSAGRKG